jgi:hypothetical protein
MTYGFLLPQFDHFSVETNGRPPNPLTPVKKSVESSGKAFTAYVHLYWQVLEGRDVTVVKVGRA